MKVKLDGFYLNVLINGLYSQRMRYDDKTNSIIDTLLLRLIDESDKLKPNRKVKICFEPAEISVIGQCLMDCATNKYKPKKKLPLRLSENCLKR